MKKKATNFYLTPMMREGFKRILQARKDRGEDVKQNQIYLEAVAEYLESRDQQTGMPKPPPAQVRFQPVTGFLGSDQDDEALFAALEETSRMAWVAAPNNDCMFVTRALAEYTGREAEEFRHMGWSEALHPDDRARTFERYRVGFHTRQPLHAVYRMRREDGLYGWIVDVSAPRFRDGRFAGYIGTMYEVASEPSAADPPASVIPAPKPVIVHIGQRSKDFERTVGAELVIFAAAKNGG